VRLLLVGSIAAYAVILAGVAAGAMTPWALIALLGSPLAIVVVRETSLFTDTSHYTRAMSKAIALTSATGILLCVAYGVAGWIK